ncbi:MAG: tetratricopeptide repeat protein [Elusimicrobiota bacterium]
MKRLVVLLLIIHFCVIISASWEKSAIYDEALNISAGYIHLKTGNFQINNEHLTFWKMFTSFPLLFFKLTIPNGLKAYQYEIADKFLYENIIPADTILHISRIVTASGAIVLGFIIFKWSFELWGTASAFLSLVLYLLCPNITAFAGFVNTDFGLTVLIFLSIYAFWQYLKFPTTKILVITGIFFGLAQSTKITALLLYPVFLILAVYYWHNMRKEQNLRNIIKSVFVVFIIGFTILFITYLFYGLLNYFYGIKQIFDITKTGGNVFINGKVYPYGRWYFYLFVFLVKNTTPFLVLLFGMIFLFILKKNPQTKFKAIFLLILPVTLFVVSSFARRQMGIRYILPVYPFLFVAAGSILMNFDIKKAGMIIPLILWMLVNNARVYPHYLTFFNELVGGSKKGYRCLVYDLDAGQDLKGLKKFLKPGDEVVLSYSGCARPEYYGIDCQYAGAASDIRLNRKVEKINSLNPKRELLAVSALFLQMARTDRGFVYSWLREYQPIDIIGNTILVYDITADINAHKNLGYTYMGLGEFANAEREWQRILIIEPRNLESHYQLARIYDYRQLYEKAIKECKLVLDKDKNSYMTYGLLGQIYMKQGKLKESKNCFKKALQINPDYPEAKRNLNACLDIMKEK